MKALAIHNHCASPLAAATSIYSSSAAVDRSAKRRLSPHRASAAHVRVRQWRLAVVGGGRSARLTALQHTPQLWPRGCVAPVPSWLLAAGSGALGRPGAAAAAPLREVTPHGCAPARCCSRLWAAAGSPAVAGVRARWVMREPWVVRRVWCRCARGAAWVTR